MSLTYRTIDPQSPGDVAELEKQRRVCGWGVGEVPTYMQAVGDGDMTYFFFCLPAATGQADGDTGGTGEVDLEVIGSGAVALAGVHEGRVMSSHAEAEFYIMGLFLYQE